MHYKLLGCKIFEREIGSVVAKSPNCIDVTTVRQRLHDYPVSLRDALQEEIDAIDDNTHRYSDDADRTPFDAIILGYGLCGQAVLRLSSKRYPLVIPKVHDCVALFLGDRERYRQIAPKSAGVFFFSPGFAAGYANRMGEGESYIDPCRLMFYLQRYKGNEKRALKAVRIEQSLTGSYHSCAYIKWPTLDLPQYEEMCKEAARKRDWKYYDIDGDDTLFARMVDTDWTDSANWDDPDFLVVPPGKCIAESYDESVLCAVDPRELEEG